MLEEILEYLNNWFTVEEIFGRFEIKGGSIELPFLANGQYFRLIGSVFNDGVYQYQPGGMNLTDESFNGAVWALAIPRTVLKIANEIDAWQQKNGAAAASPYQSESFGGYSYSKSTSGSATGAGMVTWQSVFKSRLNQWRKI